MLGRLITLSGIEMLKLLIVCLMTISCVSKDKCDINFKADFEFLVNNEGITKACLSEEAVIELRKLIRDVERDGAR